MFAASAETGLVSAGVSVTEFTLAAGADGAGITDYYTGWTVELSEGTVSGTATVVSSTPSDPPNLIVAPALGGIPAGDERYTLFSTITGTWGDVFIDTQGNVSSEFLAHGLFESFPDQNLRYIASTSNTATDWDSPINVDTSATYDVARTRPKVRRLYVIDETTFDTVPIAFAVYAPDDGTDLFWSSLHTFIPAFVNTVTVSSSGSFSSDAFLGIEVNFTENSNLQLFYPGDGIDPSHANID